MNHVPKLFYSVEMIPKPLDLVAIEVKSKKEDAVNPIPLVVEESVLIATRNKAKVTSNGNVNPNLSGIGKPNWKVGARRGVKIIPKVGIREVSETMECDMSSGDCNEGKNVISSSDFRLSDNSSGSEGVYDVVPDGNTTFLSKFWEYSENEEAKSKASLNIENVEEEMINANVNIRVDKEIVIENNKIVDNNLVSLVEEEFVDGIGFKFLADLKDKMGKADLIKGLKDNGGDSAGRVGIDGSMELMMEE